MSAKSIGPGTRVRTSRGLAWVNVSPDGRKRDGQLFVRMNDNTTVWVNEGDVEAVDF